MIWKKSTYLAEYLRKYWTDLPFIKLYLFGIDMCMRMITLIFVLRLLEGRFYGDQLILGAYRRR